MVANDLKRRVFKHVEEENTENVKGKEKEKC